MKYHLVILGCQMNYSDAERIRTVLEKMGFQSTDDEQEANLIGIVACSVRQKAIDKVYTRIYKWNKMKAKRQLVTFVSGCILDADETKFAKLFDLLFRMEQLPQLPDLLRQSGVPTSVSAPILTDEELENDVPISGMLSRLIVRRLKHLFRFRTVVISFVPIVQCLIPAAGKCHVLVERL